MTLLLYNKHFFFPPKKIDIAICSWIFSQDILKQATEDRLTSAKELPYCEGDFWPNVLEESIKELEQEEEERKRKELELQRQKELLRQRQQQQEALRRLQQQQQQQQLAQMKVKPGADQATGQRSCLPAFVVGWMLAVRWHKLFFMLNVKTLVF